ncbi:Wzz/FepE/Etk N-terminal domain-containing protein [Ornithinimicrobium cerasi]|uniref:Wzz/FepE/Etk N-terminal domain-containing protein n=1 Tax=Ornithinimicrobium cerasi TaxID=2248773 RepID=UPI0013797AF9|nr:Wzz/FepE/Etk N-terminal domain-containing protein [Ornithinimicrobium cerasi]
MTVRDLFMAIARRWRGVLAILLLVVAASALATMRTPQVFESRTTVYFAATDEDGQSTGNLYQMPAGEKATLARIARSPLMLDPVRETLGLDPSLPLAVEALPGGDDTATLRLRRAQRLAGPRRGCRRGAAAAGGDHRPQLCTDPGAERCQRGGAGGRPAHAVVAAR